MTCLLVCPYFSALDPDASTAHVCYPFTAKKDQRSPRMELY